MASNDRKSSNKKTVPEPSSSIITKQNQKKIVTNMKEVIITNKKKERSKQRRKKENIRKMEPEIMNISSVMNDSLNIVSPNISLEEKIDNKILLLSPLKENSIQSSGFSKGQEKNGNIKSKNADCLDAPITNAKSPMKMVSIRDHFSPKPKVTKALENDAEKEKQNKKLNAFEVMMNARNKSIGSNTPGKEPDKTDCDQVAGNSKAITVKRKLLLEEWAEKKGSLKRKLDDEEREEYIQYEMKKRAKRLKTMLVNGKNDTTAPKRNSNSRKKLSLKRKEEKSQTLPDEDEIIEHEKISKKQTKKRKEISEKLKTKKRLRRILSSSVSEDSNHLNSTGNEDKEFAAKLSSPIKKRDSLLGYFPKIISPTPTNSDSVCAELSEEGKKIKISEQKCNDKYKSGSKNKKKIKLNETLTTSDLDIPKSEPLNEKTNSGRPKRSCVGKTRYDMNEYELELSPTELDEMSLRKRKDVDMGKKNENKKSSVRKELLPVVRNESINEVDAEIVSTVIDLETSIDENPLVSSNINNSLRKLAPVFIRAMPKPSPDPELVKARQEFLMSGVPEKMKLDMAKLKQYEQAYEAAVEYFPKVSHILQLDGMEAAYPDDIINWKRCNIIWKNDNESHFSIGSMIREGRPENRKLLENSSISRTSLLPLQKLEKVENKKDYVKHMKIKYDKFPTYRCYKQLKEKYKSLRSNDADLDTHQLSESFVVTRSSAKRLEPEIQLLKTSQDDEKSSPSAPNGEFLFTEKYKPMTSDQVLVNLAPVKALKEFLSPWKIGRNAKNNESMCDFTSTNDSSCSSANIFNFVVLLGPSSSGKTNAVFALANELNFNVLEINAGMKRTGKKLLQELHEATQSHQVGKDGVKNNLLKQSINGLKKATIDTNNSNLSVDQNNSGKVSLILVEDADIVFEQDAGFVEAIYQLSATSKRPVIITANNPNCQHLIRLINQHVIYFGTPNVLNISKYLSVISLVENCPIDINDIVSLYLYNNRNLRKTLLEMQFFIQTGGDRARLSSEKSNLKFFLTSPHKSISKANENEKNEEEANDIKNEDFSKIRKHTSFFEFYVTCQNIERHVPFPIDYDMLRENLADFLKVSEKMKSDLSTKCISTGKKKKLEKYENILDTLTDFYEDISSALNVTTGSYSEDLYRTSLSDEISHYLVEQSLKVNLQANVIGYNLFSENRKRISLANDLSSNLLHSQRSLALDYDSCLRSICRSEKCRSQVERRGSRFYHYLRNTCCNVNSFSTELFDNCCSVLTDAKATN